MMNVAGATNVAITNTDPTNFDASHHAFRFDANSFLTFAEDFDTDHMFYFSFYAKPITGATGTMSLVTVMEVSVLV
jgi:hypothetical protein